MAFAKKSLGQNFLISERVVGGIVMAGEITPGEQVIEIGPGKGVLTAALLRAGAHVIAVEKDDRLIPLLATRFKPEISRGDLVLIHGDVLESMDAVSIRIKGHYKVIANIPYYITGQIIRQFLSIDDKPDSMILMVQKEVADRIIARDGKESILSLSVKVYATPSLVMNVSRGNFFPIPNVDSAVLKLSDIKMPFANTTDESRFFETVKAGFAQKRKKLAGNLTSVMPKDQVAQKFKALGLDDNARAEDVSLDIWIKLAQ
ncbi:MAG: 16S rRNA (adenine(1518)-N(6)/adenine(1519)-N(6))-dimethyltransferase RsmA [bacterium]|nr:16S rRNA (adenine(1518)-N(6)/adenine(1519)-N(6))-dimethyltransferase RsmA [bacterium]